MGIGEKFQAFYQRVFKPAPRTSELPLRSPYRTSSPIEVDLDPPPPTLNDLFLGEAMIRHADDLDPNVQEQALLHIAKQRELRIAWDKRHAGKL